MNLHPSLLRGASAAALLLPLAAGLFGCSGASGTGSTNAVAANTAPALVTVSDAPLSSILSAQITISSITVSTGTSGTPVSVLSAPATVQLSSLGGVQEPLELTSLPYGTYTSATVTVSRAQVTYLNSSNQATTATATISQPTVTISLSPALVVSSSGELHLHYAFDLAKSFDLTGSTLTFTPSIAALAAAVNSETGGDRDMDITGSVVSVSATAITVQNGDSGRQFTYAINSSTTYPTGVTASSITAGSLVHIQAQSQSDGTLLALSITPVSSASLQAGGANECGNFGIIVAVTADSSGNVTSFSMVPREHFGASSATATVTVTLASTTTFALPQQAQSLGLSSASFNSSELFVGQSVMVTGTSTSTGSVTAQQITLGDVGLGGTLSAVPSGTAPNLSFTLTLASTTNVGLASLTSLPVTTSSATEYNQGLTATTFAALASGTSVEVDGFLLRNSGGSYTLYANQVGQIPTAQSEVGGF
ncbi:MAG: DUF4382 domain-containing protein [Acidobacteriota bacterium]|nr:DUF4382 domain-containing protein [Acidobacteriota bacterium]